MLVSLYYKRGWGLGGERERERERELNYMYGRWERYCHITFFLALICKKDRMGVGIDLMYNKM